MEQPEHIARAQKAADILRSGRTEILENWISVVKENISQENSQLSTGIISHMHDIMELLSERLATIQLEKKPQHPEILWGNEALSQDQKTIIVDYIFLHEAVTNYLIRNNFSDDRTAHIVQNFFDECVMHAMGKEAVQPAFYENQEMLYEYFMQFPLPMAFFVGEDYYFALANKPYEDLLGCKVVGKTLRQVMVEAEAIRFIRLMNEVYRTGNGYEGKEVQFVRPRDGSTRYIDLIYTPCRNKAGSITGLITTIIDVTEKVLARNKIAESESRFKALSEENPQIIWTSSPSGKITFLSKSWLELTGIPMEEVMEQGWEKMIHPDDRERVMGHFLHSIQTGKAQENEFRLFCRRYNHYTWVLNRAHPIKNDRGEIIEWVGVAANIQTLKEAQKALYDQTQFEQHLVGIISHDLRSPLSAIENSCALLLRSPGTLSEKTQKYLKMIDKSVKRTITMVRDLLDFTRSRLTEIPLVVSPFNVLDAIFPIVEEVKLSHPYRSVMVESYWTIRVEWDFTRFQQMMQNLLTNALKYSPDDSIVTVGLNENTNTISVWVHNFGSPIPNELLREIFEPLKRNVTEMGNQARSLGLGLHIVKKLAEAHAGTISVSSSKEEGTTFTLELPRAVPCQKRASAKSSA